MTSDQATLYAYDPGTGIYKMWKSDDLSYDKNPKLLFNEMTIDPKNNIWLGTSQGLVFFDREKEVFEMFEENPDRKIERSEIYCLKFDSFGNLWIGTSSNGLLKYDTRAVLNSLVSYRNGNNSLTPGWAYRVVESSDGKVWIATIAGAGQSGINEFDPVSGSIKAHPFETIRHGLDGFTAYIEQRPGEFLVSTGFDFFQYFTGSNTIRNTVVDGFPDSVYVFNFYRDSRGDLYYCTNNSLYLQQKDSKEIRHIDLGLIPGSNASSKEVVNVFEGKKHGLWILTNNGLFLYDYNTGLVGRHGYDHASGDIFTSQDINSFYEDSNGICWVGTWQGGLSRYNPDTGKIKTYTSADGLPSMCIQGILPDEKSKALWLSTFEGISMFKIDEEVFNNFSLEDGIQGLLYADGAYLKTSGGLLVFGGNNGITAFRPDDIEKNSAPPKVFITDFKIANKSLASGTGQVLDDVTGRSKEIVLKFNQNNISIDYLGIHYANPARNKFAYMLENYDNDWREVGNARTAYYYNLPPGDYTFHVKAANSNGIWNKEGASLNIRIKPPWSKTWLAFTFYGLCLLLVVYLLDRFQRKRVLLKERILAKEKELVHAREIEKAYQELKNTQTQLLHAEKMASLGELTAGIAHEIQNPLNFVNNFSEVSAEMVDEMRLELDNGNNYQAKEITEDLKQNLDKIKLHGMRASSIVKGMLEHSRVSTGQKELININTLVDEYLRLAYHGLKAKDKTFNAGYKADLDDAIPEISVVPQDIGRVLLNLINNAFYAVSQKAKESENGYMPMVMVSTARKKDKIEIRIKDNGTGIPANLLDKIFQPFFTTKPTGQGTGLGLSLSFDIVTKGHNGELKVETTDGEGTEFIIVLPQG
jgi:signal transduction histidine kinase/sugar lactone lactonase YvrE